MAKKAAGTPATVVLTAERVAHTLHPYEVSPDSPNYGALVAEFLGVAPASLFKTLIAEVDGKLIVGVVPVTGDLDLKALAQAAGGKRATLADRAAAERSSGYVRGGISPLGQRRRLPTVIDDTAHDLDLMYVSAGRRGLQVSLAPADLIRLTSATVAPIRS
ncbi:Cys-tRNA(Pro)/Cys-tRNA(Cys) deacylase [Actinoplanes lutulentus]|uniref:Cys-tRNA(Pro)/Cys-tRNA(Cys) deacylase n=1 Tax=Actinoplanes lutulentus TaxID=1287878 RepID=A0A327ZGZ4_9ACTN|nr:Cys-tRNA(Pro) deacylase [Actinoplanes lutulentus]MBB2945453.1 Cys-tRNA(Pro)/Cys-tRNA(Cys) deacylase [Actinoplanes lutulentus]RAK40416.1 Cys-tRNA(Pro)/Cys-tRNA(Cys) deacylase [Actinoplanes lutulentus]